MQETAMEGQDLQLMSESPYYSNELAQDLRSAMTEAINVQVGELVTNCKGADMNKIASSIGSSASSKME